MTSDQQNQNEPATEQAVNCPQCGVSLEASSLPSHCALHAPPPYSDPDEINLLEYIYVLVKHKWWIIGATIAALIPLRDEGWLPTSAP